MKKIFALLILANAAPAFSQGQDLQTDMYGNCGNLVNVSIYGKDNREEYCAKDVMIRDLADSVAGFFTDGSSVTLNRLPYVYSRTTLGQSQGLAAGQRFSDQPAAAFCTGFLVGPDLMATAGHCVKDHPVWDTEAPKDHKADCQQNLRQGDFCENIRVIFGFRKEVGGQLLRSARPENVYKCVAVLSHSLKGGPDYTLIRLDRKVAGRKPLAINRANAGLGQRTPLFVIGHPSGLPLKIAADAVVISSGVDVYVHRNGAGRLWSDNNYSFLTNLDTFHGNSGSPVFNMNTLLVEGILVKGDNDYVPGAEGNEDAVYPQETGGAEMGKGVGEVCTKISVPAAGIPVTDRERSMLELNRKSGNRLYPVMMEMLERRLMEQRQSQPQIMPIPNYVPPAQQQPDVQWI
jgi:hypothetical protein